MQSLGIGVVLLTLLVACGAQGGDESRRSRRREPGTESGMADIEEIDILIMESFPVQVAVVAHVRLPDGCTEIDEVLSRFEQESDRFVVEITTVRETGVPCTLIFGVSEERIPLDVEGLPAGTYTVDVNGVTDTFTLDVDNVP
jgi:inhibitor of cysteine peptidase